MNPNLETLRARHDEIETELRSIHETAGEEALNDEQTARWEALETEIKTVRDSIAAAEEAQQRAERVAESRAKWGSLQVSTPVDPFADLAAARHMSDVDLQDRAITAIEKTSYRGLGLVTDEARQNASRVVEQIPGAARMMLATGAPDYMRAFGTWLAAQGNPVYTADEANAVRAAMSLTSANGGFALPFLLDPTLINTGTATRNPLRAISRVESGTSDKWNGVTASNVTTAWKGEGSAFTEGSPTAGGVTVDAAMLTAYVVGSFEIFQDSSWQSQLPALIAESIDYAEQTAFISGSGSDAPRGIVTAISATAGSTVTATTRGSFTSASSADTLALLNALPVRYEDSSTWVMNKATYRTINTQIVGTGGMPLIDMTDRNNLLDLPVVRASDMPSATTSGNALIVLGDFSQFIIYDRLGVSLEFIPNVVDGSGVPTGQRGLVAYKRVGSNVSDVNAFRFLKC